MVQLINSKEIPAYSHLISMNPSGTLDYNTTLKMNGLNSIIKSPTELSNDSLQQSQNNEVVCNSIEKFTNSNNIYKKIILILLILLLLFVFLYIFL